MAASVPARRASRSFAPARLLLVGGIAAGPLYILVGVLEVLFRPGFDPLRHDLSLMANGDFGWIHSGLLIVSGVLVVASSFGMRSAMADGPARSWSPRLIALYGLGLFGAGLFAADPAFGFPPGIAADEASVSWHGLLHLVSGAVGFVGLIVACFVLARRFSARALGGWATFSRVTGVVYAVAFIGIAAGAQQSGVVGTIVILAFTAAVILGWTWLSLVELQFTQEVAS